MYIMIGGGGLVGKSLAEKLVSLRHDVVVIDTDIKACEEVYAKYGAVTIHGTVTDLDTLISAGIERCNVAVATMRNDADNLAFALLARHHNVPQLW
jgi:trk system potassium uptake protein TrkA